MRGKISRTILLTLLFLAAHPDSLPACAACYGDTDAPMSKGLTWAISVLVAIIGGVLAGVVAFFIRTVKHSEIVTEDAVAGGQPTK